jgi:hypothetical protein
MQSAMTCREFRSTHVAFVDDLLSAADKQSMLEHRASCAGCARLDVRIRRSLLVARNMPRIEVSPDFMSKLNARLAATEEESGSPDSHLKNMLSLGALATLAAGLVVAGYLVASVPSAPQRGGQLVPHSIMASAVATLPESSLATDDADVGETPTRADVWPAMFVADRHSVRFGVDRPGWANTGP